jgi:uncharacterized Zn finger protein (UPF0148 family)
MKIGKTICNLCNKEKYLTKDEMLDLLDDCTTQQAILSFFIGIQIKKGEVILPVMCPECEEEYNLRWQEQQEQTQ